MANNLNSTLPDSRQRRFRLRATRRIGFLVAALLTTSAVRAAPPDANVAAALKKFEEGRSAFDAGRFEEALAAFKSSNELLPSPNSRLYVGRCYRALKKPASAYTNFRLAAREAQDRVTVSGEKRYAATRDAANGEAADIESQVPHVTLEVPSDLPQNTIVKKNGQIVPRAAWGTSVETDPGDVGVEATAPRFKRFLARFSLRLGESRRVRVELERMPTATITIKWRMRPIGASAELDGIPIDGTQDSIHEVDPGAHLITARAPGASAFSWQQSLASNERKEVTIAFATPSSARSKRPIFRAACYATGAVGIAALVSAGALTGTAQNQNATELAKNPYERSEATKNTIRTEAISASVLFAAGGVLVAGAAVFAYFGWRREIPAKVTLRPTISPTGTGLVLGGSF